MIHYSLNGRPPKAFVEKDLSRIATAVFRLMRRKSSEKTYSVSIQWVSEKHIQELNKHYRRINRPTDVLSFSASESKNDDHFPIVDRGSKEIDLGDLFICGEYAKREALRRSIDFREELNRLIVHGTMHLMGYDHADQESEERMFLLQEDAVEKIKDR